MEPSTMNYQVGNLHASSIHLRSTPENTADALITAETNALQSENDADLQTDTNLITLFEST
jgi:hypothetical protein